MILDYLRIALGSLYGRKLRSWLTVIGIVIGITAVVALIGMGQGLKVAVTSQFGSVGADKLTVTASGGFGPPGTAVVTPLTKDNLEKIEDVNGVDIAAGRLVRAGKFEFNGRVGFTYLASVPGGDARKLFEETFDLKTKSGRLLRDSDTGKIVIGSGLADTEINGKKITTGSTILLQDKKFEVLGVIDKTGSFLVDSIIMMNEDDLRDLLDIPDEDYDVIVLQVDSTADIQKVAENVRKLMRKERDVDEGDEDFEVQTPQALLEQATSTLFAIQLFVYIIAGISIVVGGIGIMNTMFTSVLERTREIGIMKSIGARNSTIFTLFFIESGLIGSVGGIIGALIGTGLATGLSAVGRSVLGADLIRADISIWLLASSIMGSFIIGSIFGIIPALNASRLHPVDALSHRK